ncbi:MAG TPA: hypothetical protein VNU45_00335, partial [Rummeliibacillus sp.]|nr:hypothetical protein [Rummeliibacillus sp.]
MITCLKSLLIENGFDGDWSSLKFKFYNGKSSGQYWTSISEFTQLKDQFEIDFILSRNFDTDCLHPDCYQILADCGEKQILLTTKTGS